MIRSGRMRHRFELHQPKLDAEGQPLRNSYGSPTGETELVSRPWCNIIDVNSVESNGTALNGQEIIKFEIRFSKQLNNPQTHMYIIFEDEKYDITSSVDVHKRREKLHILATKRR